MNDIFTNAIDIDFFSPKYVTYSYQEGLLYILQIATVALIFAVISMLIALIIGIRKKDCLAILVTNIMIKTVAMYICKILYDLLYIDNFLVVLLLVLIATITVEGFIYKKVLKYKKLNGMIVSVICNSLTVGIVILFLPKLLSSILF